MFSSKKIDPEKSITIIGEQSSITGNLSSPSNIRIDGKISGDINTTARLVMGPTAEVLGNINAHSSEISGKVSGNIIVEDLLFFRESAIIEGNVSSKKLIVEAGAQILGKLSISNKNLLSNEE